jgi:hypothetical protein
MPSLVRLWHVADGNTSKVPCCGARMAVRVDVCMHAGFFIAAAGSVSASYQAACCGQLKQSCRC